MITRVFGAMLATKSVGSCQPLWYGELAETRFHRALQGFALVAGGEGRHHPGARRRGRGDGGREILLFGQLDRGETAGYAGLAGFGGVLRSLGRALGLRRPGGVLGATSAVSRTAADAVTGDQLGPGSALSGSLFGDY